MYQHNSNIICLCSSMLLYHRRLFNVLLTSKDINNFYNISLIQQIYFREESVELFFNNSKKKTITLCVSKIHKPSVCV